MSIHRPNLNQSRLDAKHQLRDVLTRYGGDPKHEAIASALEHLIQLNPNPAPTQKFDLVQGQWRLISAPSFPDGERQEDGSYVYRLGRFAFNMFQPTDLKVVVQDVSQAILPIEGSSKHTHDIVVTFATLSTEFPPLQGRVRNLGVCEPSNDTAIQVQFTGGVLEPSEGADLHIWKQVFGNPTASAPSTFKEKLQGLFLKFMFGLVPPTEMDTQTGRIEFKMKRSPKGSLEILYLDNELRITKGEKGTVLIGKRES